MYYSGFADEASADITTQIRATRELGWQAIEARNVGSANITDISEAEFDQVCAALETGQVRIDCFGSAVANWSKDPRSAEDFECSMASLRRAIPRMQRLGVPAIRGMSFAVVCDETPDSPQLEHTIFEKLRALVRVCEEGGVTYLHENCANYGGMSYEHTLRMLEVVSSPYFRLVFDTGNPVGTDRRIGQPPYAKQSSWEFYQHVKEFVQRVHIKDAIFERDGEGIFPERRHVYPGEGQGEVARILADLLAGGYQGALSIEPHLAVVYHDSSVQSPDEIRYANYVEYGRRLMHLVEQVKGQVSAG
jgi:sugar phosphate isomerase/epimerase